MYHNLHYQKKGKIEIQFNQCMHFVKNQFASLPLLKKLQMKCYGIIPDFDESL